MLNNNNILENESETKILTLGDLRNIPSGNSIEPLVDVRAYDSKIIATYEKFDMMPYVNDQIFVRDTVAKKLSIANNILQKNGHYTLKVVYGYRHPEIQRFYFEKRKAVVKKEKPQLTDDELTSFVHLFVAEPSVAGHPTGGAIDITIAHTDGTDLLMGGKIGDFSDEEKIRTFSKNISEEEQLNRVLLRKILMEQDFAPFNGEWWHFSYGDIEWAAFYNKKTSLYGQIDFRIIKSNTLDN